MGKTENGKSEEMLELERKLREVTQKMEDLEKLAEERDTHYKRAEKLFEQRRHERGGYHLLSLNDIIEIKTLLWDGYTMDSVAHKIGCSISTVGAISSGRMYGYIPWKDGSPGSMPLYRKAEIRAERKAMGRARAHEMEALMYSDHMKAGEAQGEYHGRWAGLFALKDQIQNEYREKVSEMLEPREAIPLHGTIVPHMERSLFHLHGQSLEYIPFSELPILPEELQKLRAIAEEDIHGEPAFGAVLAKLEDSGSAWTLEAVQPLYESIQPTLERLERTGTLALGTYSPEQEETSTDGK